MRTEVLFSLMSCAHTPPALFDNFGLMRKANKPALADAMWSQHKPQSSPEPSDTVYVLDGGSLLQRLPWPLATYKEIANMYSAYVVKKYGSATVVFDGYPSGPSTKDFKHQRRTKGHKEPVVSFTEDMVCKGPKDKFLSNRINKPSFISVVGRYLDATG